jgi:Z1 domain
VADQETVEILPLTLKPGMRWNPVVGAETQALLKHLSLDDDGRQSLSEQAVNILGRCLPPNEISSRTTGLAIGYVQSGKTMSFTTVAALARDNSYRVVIILCGISIPLLTQSSERLEKDLRLQTRPDRSWKAFLNPKSQRDRSGIEIALDNWMDSEAVSSDQQTILITVMKNVSHLKNLTILLKELHSKLEQAPVLVIDDEADQAGLNTQVKLGRKSATYRELLDMRRALPHHSYLQYTATPQAPLLINIIDALSPDFAHVLQPGNGYTGGRIYFQEHRELTVIIPDSEIPGKDEELIEPPRSLHRALQIFFLGVAAARVLDPTLQGNRSMMVHPSQITDSHNQYINWVQSAVNQWKTILTLSSNESDRVDLINSFQISYNELKQTVRDLPTFDNLINQLRLSISSTRITEMNAAKGKIPQIAWYHDYPNIIVGGQALDRGFTVEGLTVTYMPRGLGVGNADTVQQRARFFGYKEKYLGYCRVFLGNSVFEGFESYVEHEESIRSLLSEYNITGKPLQDWKRAFFLNPNFRPTRPSVIDLDFRRVDFSDKWFTPEAPHEPLESIEANRQVVDTFISDLKWEDDIGHAKRTPPQHHLVSQVLLSEIYQRLLIQIRFARPKDSQNFTGLLLQLKVYQDEYPDEICSVYQMSKGLPRERTLNTRGVIPTLFQGKNKDIYPGDSAIRASIGVSIQIHILEITDETGNILKNVPAVAVWIPQNMENPSIVQAESKKNV